MTSYAYIHCKPDGTPFYVGKGVRSRYKDFKYRNVYHKRVVAKYGEQNILIGKMDCTTNDIALQLEIGLIKCFRRMGVKLTNLTDGGEGNVGWKCPDNVKAAVVESNKNRTFTEEQKKRIGDKFRGKKRPEHAALMAARGTWKGEKNIWFGTGERQRGAKNHMARAVCGMHPMLGNRSWGTLQDAANSIGVTIQAVFQAIRKKQTSKGWTLEYKS